ncbi:MAG: hypothetical protein AVDCRST_MAG11-3174, partial [uncultured Gemmatimonadaceae bacterium]
MGILKPLLVATPDAHDGVPLARLAHDVELARADALPDLA